MPEVMFLLWY